MGRAPFLYLALMRRRHGLLLATLLVAGCGTGAAPTSSDVVLGVLLPLHGAQASLAQEELNGIQVAVDSANSDRGLRGRRLRLEVRDVTTREAAPGAVASLKNAGATVVLGTYSSQLSIPAAHAASAAGLVYWETGAVADQLTGEALPHVFRVGASGTNLGRGSAAFAAEQLAPRLHKPVSAVRMTLVQMQDPYGESVAAAAMAEANRVGMRVAAPILYDNLKPDWDTVFTQVRASAPDVLVLASYIPDGIAFRHAMLAHQLHVGALIGSTMAECGPEFGDALGADAIGVFASDRPTRGFNPGALSTIARAAYDRLVSAYHARFHREAGEEAISGYSAAWVLVTRVLPAAHGLSADAIAAAASAMDLAYGSLPNGGGLRFAGPGPQLGQNTRAASVVWQWQGVRQSVTVWPAVFATGQVQMVPLPR